MAVCDIKILGDECLRLKSMPVERGKGDIPSLLKTMKRVMKEKRGVGLAAPQVGINERVIIIDSGEELLEIINPEISTAEGSAQMTEGCLSVPGAEVNVQRADKILLKGCDRSFKPLKLSLEGLPARIVQHEIDHLDGVLIVDYMSVLKRKIFEKKWKKNSG